MSPAKVPSTVVRFLLLVALAGGFLTTPAHAQSCFSPPYWRIDTFNAANLNNHGSGNMALWCGANPTCFSTPPGYGNNWDGTVVWTGTMVNPAVGQTVALDFVFNYDTEPLYDFFTVEYESAGTWITVLTLSGTNKGSGGVFPAPGVQYASTGAASIVYAGGDYGGPNNDEIRIRFRFRSDAAWSDEDGLWGTSGAVQIDDASVLWDDGNKTQNISFSDFDNTNDWVITPPPPTVDFAGLANTALGNAVLSVGAGGELQVSNIGSSGVDGVAVDLGEAEGLEMMFDPALASGTPKRSDVFTQVGSTNNEVEDEQFLAFGGTGSTGGGWSLQADFSAIGSSTFYIYIVIDSFIAYQGSGFSNNQAVVTLPAPIGVIRDEIDENGVPRKVIVKEDPTTPVGITVAGQGTFQGDTVIFVPESQTVATDFFTGTELTAGGPSQITIGQERPQVFGAHVTAQAGALLQPQNGGSQIIVSNIGSSGQDGVAFAPSFDPAESTSAADVQAMGFTWHDLNPGGTVPDGAYVEVGATGETGGVPDQSLGTLRITDVGAEYEVTADYSPIGSATQLIRIYNGSGLVAEVSGHTGPVAHVPSWPGGCTKERVIVGGAGTACFWPQWPTPVQIDVVGGPSVTGTRLAVLAENPTTTLDALEQLSVHAADVPEITFDGSTIALGPPRQGASFGGLDHMSLGAATLDASSGNLIVSNIGSSGEDGVAIGVGELEQVDLDFGATLDPQALPEGSSIEFSAVGRVSGQTGQHPVGRMRAQVVGGQFELSGNFADVGATHYTVEIFRAGQLVYRRTDLENDEPMGVLVWVMKLVDKKYHDGEVVSVTVKKIQVEVPEEVSLSDGGSVLGDTICMYPTSTAMAVTALTGSEVRAAGMSQFTIEDEILSALGQRNRGRGDAWLVGEQGGARLTVSNIGSSGEDGLSVHWEDDPDGRCPTCPARFTAAWDSLDGSSLPVGAYLQVEATGQVGGSWNQQLGSLRFTQTASDVEITADYSAVGASTQRIQVYDGETLVADVMGHTGPVARVPVMPGGCGKELVVLEGQDTACYWPDWPQPVPIEIVGGATVMGDRLAVLAESPTSTIGPLNSFSLLGADLPSIHLTGAVATGLGCVCTTPEWRQEQTVTSPSARYSQSMAYDSARQVTVLFGGTDGTNRYDDTWEWDGRVWVQRTPATSPPPRSNANMAYDSQRRVVVLYGGRDDAGRLDDTWEWNGSNWTQIVIAGAGAKSNAGFAYDPGRGVVVLQGGDTNSGQGQATYEYDGTAWTLRSPAASPGSRSRHVMVYDESLGKIVAFGGRAPSSVLKGDTWTWDGNNWAQVAGTGPEARELHAGAYNSSCGGFYVYGGWNLTNRLDDLWRFENGQWTQVTTGVVTPVPLSNHWMTYDAARDRLTMFGGYDGATGIDETWTFGCAVTATATPPVDALRGVVRLLPNYPNPFNPKTAIRYELDRPGPVSVQVVDLRGRVVTTLVDGFQLPGFYTVEWPGTDLHGQTVASGTYFYVLRANGERHAGKMVLMK